MSNKLWLRWFLIMMLMCVTLLFTLSIFATYRQTRLLVSWLPFMEFGAPTLIFSWALMIHFVHKARAA